MGDLIWKTVYVLVAIAMSVGYYRVVGVDLAFSVIIGVFTMVTLFIAPREHVRPTLLIILSVSILIIILLSL